MSEQFPNKDSFEKELESFAPRSLSDDFEQRLEERLNEAEAELPQRRDLTPVVWVGAVAMVAGY